MRSRNWGLLSGAMALGRATDYLQSRAHGNALIIAVELPSLPCPAQGFSQAISSPRFCLVCGAASGHRSSNPDAPGPRILVSETYNLPAIPSADGIRVKSSVCPHPAFERRSRNDLRKNEAWSTGFSVASCVTLPNPAAGFSIPGRAWLSTCRKILPDQVRHPPSWDILATSEIFPAPRCYLFCRSGSKAAPKQGDIAFAAALAPASRRIFWGLRQW